MGYVYLISEDNEENKYKIGSTRKENVEERMKELQTGNPNKLILVNSFKTSKPFKLETMLHNFYQYDNELNEWFSLTKEQVSDFTDNCLKYQNIIDTLKDNPYF